MHDPRTPFAGKAIRLGVVKEGRIVLEKRLELGASLTVGSSRRATVRCDAPGVPRLHPLVAAHRGAYELRAPRGLSGRVQLGGRMAGLDEALGPARRAPFGGGDRGTVKLGDLTLLFQLVDAPPSSLRQLRPAPFRARLLADDDPVFVAFLGLFSVLAGAFSAWAVSAETPDLVADLQPHARTILRLAPPRLPPVEQALAAVAPEPERERPRSAEEPPAAPAPEPVAERPRSAEERRAEELARRAEAEREVLERSMLIQVLATRGDGHGPLLPSDALFDGEAVPVDWARLEREGAPRMVQFGLKEGSGAGLGTTDAELALGLSQGGQTAIGGAGAATVEGVLRPEPMTGTGTGPAAARVQAAVRGYQGRIKTCYERRLKEDPTLAGRLELAWVVDGGRAHGVEVLSDTLGDDALEDCITDSIALWQFPADIVDFEVRFPFVLEPG